MTPRGQGHGSVYGHGAGLAGLRVFDPGGELVISGSVDEVLAELVGLPT